VKVNSTRIVIKLSVDIVYCVRKWFPTFSGLRYPAEEKYNLRHPVSNA